MAELARWCEELALAKLLPQTAGAVLQAAEARGCRRLSRQARRFLLANGELALGAGGTAAALSEAALLSIIQSVRLSVAALAAPRWEVPTLPPAAEQLPSFEVSLTVRCLQDELVVDSELTVFSCCARWARSRAMTGGTTQREEEGQQEVVRRYFQAFGPHIRSGGVTKQALAAATRGTRRPRHAAVVAADSLG